MPSHTPSLLPTAKSNKIIKPSGVQPNELELEVVKCFTDIESGYPELTGVKKIVIVSAKEVETDANSRRKSLIITVPFRVYKDIIKYSRKINL